VARVEFSAAIDRWINQLSEADYRRLAADIDDLLASRPRRGVYPFDPEERIAIPLRDGLRELVFFERSDRRKRSLSYYISADGRVLFLTLFRLNRTRDQEIRRARVAMERAVADGDSVDSV
jgi:hypothetical protein